MPATRFVEFTATTRLRPCRRRSPLPQPPAADRSWWSKLVNGLVGGVPPPVLDAMVALERAFWGEILSTRLFLIRRAVPLRPEAQERWPQWCDMYKQLVPRDNLLYPVLLVANE